MSETAILLNSKARGVTPRVVDSIARRVPSESVFVSKDLDEAQELTHEIMSRGFQRVLTGGGDGTLVNFLNHSLDFVDRSGAPGQYPIIGVLALGTGNGIGAYVGAEQYLPDLHRMMGQGVRRLQRLSLIEVEGRYCHFSGFGLDAAILNDYFSVKDTRLGRRLRYALSVPFVSIPKQITVRRRYPVARVINEGSDAYRIGDDGLAVGPPIGRGETIYHGPVQIGGVGTNPYFGYKFKIFPHVDRRPGKMQLRISSASTFETLVHLPKVWNGTYRSETIRDYWCEKVRFVFEQETPFQIGGDAAGLRKEVTFSLSQRTVELIDLTQHRGAHELN